MSLQGLMKEISELKNSIIRQCEPQNRIFIFRENGLTDAGENEEDVRSYAVAHPHTHIVTLFVEDMGAP